MSKRFVEEFMRFTKSLTKKQKFTYKLDHSKNSLFMKRKKIEKKCEKKQNK